MGVFKFVKILKTRLLKHRKEMKIQFGLLKFGLIIAKTKILLKCDSLNRNFPVKTNIIFL
jgi:hypothetical protein